MLFVAWCFSSPHPHVPVSFPLGLIAVAGEGTVTEEVKGAPNCELRPSVLIAAAVVVVVDLRLFCSGHTHTHTHALCEFKAVKGRGTAVVRLSVMRYLLVTLLVPPQLLR